MSFKSSTFVLLATLLVALFFTGSQGACVNGNPDTNLDSGEECDSGLHCTATCTCESGYEPTTPVTTSCIEICYNPITPLSASVESSLTVSMASSLVDFHALVEHQTTSDSGSTVTGTTITFGTSSVCDYPENSVLGLQTLDAETCVDDFVFTSLPFAEFSPCLALTCLDNNNAEIDCLPEQCTAPPCRKRWANSVKIARTYNVFNENNVSFPVTSTAFHPVEFQFPWIQSTSFNSAAWATPNVAGSAVITSVVFNPLADPPAWSVVVSASMNWPYRLVKPVSTDTINDQIYTVSACASTPSSSTPCVQTISFSVPGCTGLNTIFGGVATSFTGLKYECSDFNSVDCPLASGDIRAATINVILDSDAPCGPVVTETVVVQSDLTFLMKQPNYSSNRTSFIEGDTLNFRLDISKSIPTAAISSISVVSFKETDLHGGVSLATTKVTTGVCASPSTLCFDFDTDQLTAIPDNVPETDLTFVVIIQIEFSGITKKRAILEVSNFQLSTEATVTQDSSSGAEGLSTFLFSSLLISFLAYLLL